VYLSMKYRVRWGAVDGGEVHRTGLREEAAVDRLQGITLMRMTFLMISSHVILSIVTGGGIICGAERNLCVGQEDEKGAGPPMSVGFVQTL
jgi:hypothetical protein